MKKNMLKVIALVAFCISLSSCYVHRGDHGRGHDHDHGHDGGDHRNY